MGRRKLKALIFSLLAQENPEEIFRFSEEISAHILIHYLFLALCHPDEQVRWNSVNCFGRVVPRLAEENPEEARVVMRRFLWSLNDESGGIGWGCPEAMAEIMCYSSILRNEYLHMLISYMKQDGEEIHQDGNYLELPMLQRGLLWGIARLCQLHGEEMAGKNIVDDVTAYLDSTDLHVVALAIWTLGLLGCGDKIKKNRLLKNQVESIRLYRNLRFENVSLKKLLEETVISL
ncbi:DVU0298 family protein [Desulfomarina sp.]